MVILSVLRVNGRLNGVFVAERRRIRVSFLVNRKCLYEIVKQEVKRSQSEAFSEDRSIGSANHKRFQKIRTPDSVSSNQILRTHLHTHQIPFRPIRSFGRTFRRTIFRLVQSDLSDGLSDGPSSVSSNQILRSFTGRNQIAQTVIKPLYTVTVIRVIHKIGRSDPQA